MAFVGPLEDDILDNMEARINHLRHPCYAGSGRSLSPVLGAGDHNRTEEPVPKKPRLPPYPFFVQLKSFMGCGHLAFCSIIDKEMWSLYAFCMLWVKTEIEKGEVERLATSDLKVGSYVLLKKNDRDVYVRAYITNIGEDRISALDMDEGNELDVPVDSTGVYKMPAEAFVVPLMAIQVQIDKTQLFKDTDLVYQAFQELNLQNAVFTANAAKVRCSNPEAFALELLTEQKENLGEILLKKMKTLCSVPFPRLDFAIQVSITHFLDNGEVFYQTPLHQSKILKIIEDFDVLIRRELPTIRAFFPSYSNEEVVKSRLYVKDEVFAAPYSEDGKYYRAEVVDIYDGKPHMRFFDYGNDEQVEIANIVILDEFDPAIRALPPMSRRIKLHNINTLDSEMMNDILERYTIKMKVVQNGAKYEAELFMTDDVDKDKPLIDVLKDYCTQ